MATRFKTHRLTHVAAAALAAALLAGCAGQGLAVRSNSADAAKLAMAKGNSTKAIANAEAAVAASPRDAALRALLGQVYFKAGRFNSAATTYDDAMKLGDNTARTALSLALAKIGAGDQQGALAVLDDWRDEIPASDLGLALALAGEPARGVIVLSESIRGGDNTPKARQNLAFAYALAGRWKEARLMAAEDVPAEKLGDRMAEWAGMVEPQLYRERLAVLLGTPLRADPGQPAALALANNPVEEQMLAEGSADPKAPVVPAAALATKGELPPADSAVPAVPAVPAAVDAPPADSAVPAETPAPAAATGLAFVSNPTVQPLPASPAVNFAPAPKKAVAKPRLAAAVKPTSAPGTHYVQLGSFSSPQGARRAWGIYAARNKSLAGYRMTITPAVVNGKNVWRVAAAGLTGQGAANGLCSQVKNRGGACFAYAAPKTLPAPGKVNVGGPEYARRR